MKTKSLPVLAIASAICALSFATFAQDMESASPVVIKTIPEAGTGDVPPGEYEIKITFSKEMADKSWSWCSVWDNSDPKSVGKPHYDTDHKTCVMKVKLEPGKTYGYWINSQNFHGFRDTKGHASVPYLLTFKTKAE
jgi:hypothetical protein